MDQFMISMNYKTPAMKTYSRMRSVDEIRYSPYTTETEKMINIALRTKNPRSSLIHVYGNEDLNQSMPID